MIPAPVYEPLAHLLPVAAAARASVDALTIVGALGGAAVGVGLLAWHVWREVHRG